MLPRTMESSQCWRWGDSRRSAFNHIMYTRTHTQCYTLCTRHSPKHAMQTSAALRHTRPTRTLTHTHTYTLPRRQSTLTGPLPHNDSENRGLTGYGAQHWPAPHPTTHLLAHVSSAGISWDYYATLRCVWCRVPLSFDSGEALACTQVRMGAGRQLVCGPLTSARSNNRFGEERVVKEHRHVGNDMSSREP